MSGPVHQHYIPKSYLKNFAQQKEDKYFVEAKRTNEDVPKQKPISILDICVKKNLYTLSKAEGDDKFALEKYYAKEIDAVYPEVYGWLTDPNFRNITNEHRKKILLTTLSLFFRTPKFLKMDDKEVEIAIKEALDKQKDGLIEVKWHTGNISCKVDEIENVREKLYVQNKEVFLTNHLEDLHTYVELKMTCGIAVYKLEKTELISCDNPVNITGIFKKAVDIFHPDNLIQLPIDRNHYLCIMPNNIEGADFIVRQNRTEDFGITLNNTSEREADEWIYGYPGTVTTYLNTKDMYDRPIAELKQIALKKGTFLLEFIHLTMLIKSNGLTSDAVICKIKEMQNDELYKNSKELASIIQELKEAGVEL